MKKLLLSALVVLSLSVLVAPHARAIGDPDQPEGTRLSETVFSGVTDTGAPAGDTAPGPVLNSDYCAMYEASGRRATHYGFICLLQWLMENF
jgi:hypothetical protein